MNPLLFGECPLQNLLDYAVLAPSGHNTQPWMFFSGEEGLDLHADWSRALPALDPDGRELIMSCGAALFHFMLAARHFGPEPEVQILPDPQDHSLLARIRPGRPVGVAEAQHSFDADRLFRAIPHRHTSWLPFDTRPLPPDLLPSLQDAARAEGALLHVVSREQRDLFYEILLRSAHQLAESLPFRREMEEWIGREKNSWGEGIPGYPLYVGTLASYVGPLNSLIDPGDVLAEHSRMMADRAPLIVCLSVAQDTVEDWLAAGRSLDRVLLRAAAEGVSAGFLNAPVQVPEQRVPLHHLLGDGMPVAVLALGRPARPQSPTPRRPAAAVLVQERPQQQVPDTLYLPPLRGAAAS